MPNLMDMLSMAGFNVQRKKSPLEEMRAKLLGNALGGGGTSEVTSGGQTFNVSRPEPTPAEKLAAMRAKIMGNALGGAGVSEVSSGGQTFNVHSPGSTGGGSGSLPATGGAHGNWGSGNGWGSGWGSGWGGHGGPIPSGWASGGGHTGWGDGSGYGAANGGVSAGGGGNGSLPATGGAHGNWGSGNGWGSQNLTNPSSAGVNGPIPNDYGVPNDYGNVSTEGYSPIGKWMKSLLGLTRGIQGDMPNFLGMTKDFGNPWAGFNDATSGAGQGLQKYLQNAFYNPTQTSAQNTLEGFLGQLMGQGGPNMPGAPTLGQYGDFTAPQYNAPGVQGIDFSTIFPDFQGPSIQGFNSPQLSKLGFSGQNGAPSFDDLVRMSQGGGPTGGNLGRENLPLSNFQQNMLYGNRQGQASQAFGNAISGANSLLNTQDQDFTQQLDAARQATFDQAARAGLSEAARHGATAGSLGAGLVAERTNEAAQQAYGQQVDAMLRARQQTGQQQQAGLNALTQIAPQAAGSAIDLAGLLSGESQNLGNLLVQQRGQDTQLAGIDRGRYSTPAEMLQALTGAATGTGNLNLGMNELLFGQNNQLNQLAAQLGLGGYEAETGRYGTQGNVMSQLINAATTRGLGQGGLMNDIQQMIQSGQLQTNQLNANSLLEVMGIGANANTNMNQSLIDLFNAQSNAGIGSFNAQTNQQNNILNALLGLGGQQQNENQFGAQQNLNVGQFLGNLIGTGAQGNQSYLETMLGAGGTDIDTFMTLLNTLGGFQENPPGLFGRTQDEIDADKYRRHKEKYGW